MRARRVHVVLLAVVAVAFTVKAQRYLLKKYLFSSLSEIYGCLQWMSIPERSERS